jgi:hypothetical protein
MHDGKLLQGQANELAKLVSNPLSATRTQTIPSSQATMVKGLQSPVSSIRQEDDAHATWTMAQMTSPAPPMGKPDSWQHTIPNLRRIQQSPTTAKIFVYS